MNNTQHANCRQRPFSFPLLAIILTFLALGSTYLWLIPPFEGPDEAQHFAYMRWLITNSTLPPQGEAAWQNGVEQESGQPPLYYAIASLPARLTDIDNPPAIYRPNPYFVGPLPRSRFDHDNRQIVHTGDGRPLRGGWLALYLARHVTLGFGVLLLVALYGLGRQVWPQTPSLALGAVALVAFTPQVIYISSMASNDVPAAALSTLALWQFARYLRRPPQQDWLWGALIGLIVGAAALTKVSALAVGLPIGLGLLWRWRGRRAQFAPAFWFGVAFTGGVTAVFGWWLLHGWLTYGSPLGLNPHDQTPWAITDPAMLSPFWLRWQEVWRTYWLALGWGTIRLGYWPGGWPYTLFFGLLALAAAGWLRAAWLWRQPARRPEATTLLLLVLLAAGLVLNLISLESWMQRVIAPYGRLLFPSIGIITVLLVYGWYSLHPRLAWLAIACVGVIAALVPPLLIRPAYTMSFLSDAEAAGLPRNQSWHFGETAVTPFAELLYFAPQQRSVETGDVLAIDLCWHALAATAEDYIFSIQIIGPQDSLIVARRAYPGLGRHPTSQWQPGQTWCETLHVTIWQNLERSLAYQIEIFFLAPDGETRLAIIDPAGNTVSNLFIDRVRLVNPEKQQFATDLPPTPPFHLLNAEFTPTWTVASSVPITLTWAAAQPAPVDYQVFAHLVHPQTGEIVAQADGAPLAGWYPTSWWDVGEMVRDTHTFTLPTDLPPGNYRLVVGLYDLTSGARPMPEIDLGVIEVRP